MLEVGWVCDQPLEEGEGGVVGLLEGAVEGAQLGGLVGALLEVGWEVVEGGSGGVVAEADAVLVVLFGEAVGEAGCVEGAVFEGQEVHGDEVSGQTLEEEDIDAGLRGERGAGDACVAGLLDMLEELRVDGHADDGGLRRLQQSVNTVSMSECRYIPLPRRCAAGTRRESRAASPELARDQSGLRASRLHCSQRLFRWQQGLRG